MTHRRWLSGVSVAAIVALTLWSLSAPPVSGQDPELTVLTAEQEMSPPATGGPIAMAPGSGPHEVLILEGGGRLISWRASDRIRRFGAKLRPEPMPAPHMFTSLPDGHYVVIDGQHLRIFGESGEHRRSFPVPAPSSVAVLRNGDIAVAAPTTTGLVRVWSPLGVIRGTFGTLKPIDADLAENRFLNRGVILPTESGDLFYVSLHAPNPFVLRFASDGRVLGEFAVDGEAVRVSAERASSFLATRPPGVVGGIDVITSAALDAQTGHLWIASAGGPSLVYEYTDDGRKVGECI